MPQVDVCKRGWINFYTIYKQEKGFSIHTLDAYKRDLNDWQRYVEETKITFISANADDIRAFIGKLYQKNIHPRTLQRRLSAIRCFYRFLKKRKLHDIDPTIRDPYT